MLSGLGFQNAKAFLNHIQTMYRMDRGDRIYVRRHFRRWSDVARIIAETRAPSCFSRFLDVGCGSGFFMLMFNGRAVGLDNEENVAVCRRRQLQAFSVNVEEDRFPFRDGSFDGVTCLEVLEHLGDPRKMLTEIFRVLKPHGYFVVSTPNCRMPTWRLRDFLLKFRLIGRLYLGRNLGCDRKRYSRDELKGLLLSCGFDVRFWYSRIFLPCDDLVAVARKA